MTEIAFRPKLVEALRRYHANDLTADIAAGVAVGVVALPLAMAFAIASGLKPEAGIYTAIVAGFLISALGGSRVQIGGPAGAFIVVVYGIVTRYGVDGLVIAALMSGALLLAMGAFRLGGLIRFVPVSIVIGFTNAIAVLIALSQVKDVLGLRMPEPPADFFSRIYAIATHLDSVNPFAVALGAGTAAIVMGWPRLASASGISGLQRVPGSIVALILGTALVSFLGLPVETIGQRFGGIPAGLPTPSLPHLHLDQLPDLVRPAITLAILGAIESLLCARVADGMIDDRHDPNQELVAQGLANLAAPLLGGYCATGTIARTVTNVRSGARSPVAGIVHALTLLAILLVAAPLARDVPLAVLGGILLCVAYNMGEWHEFVRLRHFTNNYRAILLSTFGLTVVVDLTVAVEVGLALSFFFFVTRVTSLTSLEPVPEIEAHGRAHIGRDVEAYRLLGSLFFATVDKIEALADTTRSTPRILVLSLSNLLNIDSSGVDALEHVRAALAKRGCRMLIAGAQGQPLSLLRRSGFIDKIGADCMFDSTAKALDAADLLLEKPA